MNSKRRVIYLTVLTTSLLWISGTVLVIFLEDIEVTVAVKRKFAEDVISFSKPVYGNSKQQENIGSPIKFEPNLNDTDKLDFYGNTDRYADYEHKLVHRDPSLPGEMGRGYDVPDEEKEKEKEGYEKHAFNQYVSDMISIHRSLEDFRNAAKINPAKPVQVEVYYESLCPDSRDFIINQLWPTFDKLYKFGIFNVSMYSYGNSRVIKKNKTIKFRCQHGSTECYLNKIQTCASHLYPEVEKHLQFIVCMMLQASEDTAWKCALNMGLDAETIFTCANEKLGNQLEYKTGEKTPKHSFIPWIVVNGESGEAFNEEVISNFTQVICEKYKGHKPLHCQKRKIYKLF